VRRASAADALDALERLEHGDVETVEHRSAMAARVQLQAVGLKDDLLG